MPLQPLRGGFCIFSTWSCRAVNYINNFESCCFLKITCTSYDVLSNFLRPHCLFWYQLFIHELGALSLLLLPSRGWAPRNEWWPLGRRPGRAPGSRGAQTLMVFLPPSCLSRGSYFALFADNTFPGKSASFMELFKVWGESSTYSFLWPISFVFFCLLFFFSYSPEHILSLFCLDFVYFY